MTGKKRNPALRTLRRILLTATGCFFIALITCTVLRSGELEIILPDGFGTSGEVGRLQTGQ